MNHLERGSEFSLRASCFEQKDHFEHVSDFELHLGVYKAVQSEFRLILQLDAVGVSSIIFEHGSEVFLRANYFEQNDHFEHVSDFELHLGLYKAVQSEFRFIS